MRRAAVKACHKVDKSGFSHDASEVAKPVTRPERKISSFSFPSGREKYPV